MRNRGLHIRRSRRGAVLLLVAFLSVFIIGMLAFAIDVGCMVAARTDVQRAADAGCFAAVGALVDGQASATAKGKEIVKLNSVAGKFPADSDITIEYGTWDENSRSFTVNADSPSAVRLTVKANGRPLFFGKIFGQSSYNTQATAIAVFQPRDIMLALDYSGSMNDDSTFVAYSKPGLGKSSVDANQQQIYSELGSPKLGKMTWSGTTISSSYSDSTILSKLGLSSKPWPYSGGSWSDYINYVQKNNGDCDDVGYQNVYGYRTWVNYLLTQQANHSDCPDLADCSEQPLTAMKDAVDLFISYLQTNKCDDKVGFSIYTASDLTAKLESGLTTNLSSIATLVRARQAGHYTGNTNISAGLNKARLELQNNARAGTLKMIVLMTDGVANLPGSTNNAKNAVITEANACASAKIPVVCIGLGAEADTALLQQVADITGGVCFIVPGGQSVDEVKAQLQDVFRQVAANRPLKMVQ